MRRQIGDFYVHTLGGGFGKEMMLSTHGSHKAELGMTVQLSPATIVFYGRHGGVLQFEHAFNLVRGGREAAEDDTSRPYDPHAFLGPGNPVWNYRLTAFDPYPEPKQKDAKQNDVKQKAPPPRKTGQRETLLAFSAWQVRVQSAQPWDWWTVTDKPSNMEAFFTALKQSGAKYEKIHFLCCRFDWDWLGVMDTVTRLEWRTEKEMAAFKAARDSKAPTPAATAAAAASATEASEYLNPYLKSKKK